MVFGLKLNEKMGLERGPDGLFRTQMHFSAVFLKFIQEWNVQGAKQV